MAEHEIERVLERRERSNYITSRSLNVLSHIHYQLDRLELAEAAALAALRIARREGDSDQIRQSLINLANPRFDSGQFRSAATIYRRAISLRKEGESSQDVAIALFNLGSCHHRLGDHRKAEDMYQQGLAMAERMGNPRLMASGLLHRGRSLFLEGKLEEARSNLMESRAIGMAYDYCSETFDSTYYLWRMAIGQKVGSEAAELFRVLKKLRLRVDQRSEEVLSFDACLTEVRSRRRQKGA
jgi:tetratricopeptide (TPR) repeat protein